MDRSTGELGNSYGYEYPFDFTEELLEISVPCGTPEPPRPPVRPFEMRFVGEAEMRVGSAVIKVSSSLLPPSLLSKILRNNLFVLQGIVAGEFLKLPEDPKSLLTVQVFADGNFFNTRVQVLATVVHGEANFIDLPKDRQGNPITPPKTRFGASVYFPDGVELGNLPLIGKIPNIKYLPALGNGSFFSYSSENDGVVKLMDSCATNVMRKGALVNKELHAEAKKMEAMLRKGPPQYVGINIPKMTIPLDKLEGPLEPLSQMVTKGSHISFEGLIDPKRGNYDMVLGLKGNIDLGSTTASFEDGSFDAAFKRTLQDQNEECKCPEGEDCVKLLKDKTDTCWKIELKVAGDRTSTNII